VELVVAMSAGDLKWYCAVETYRMPLRGVQPAYVEGAGERSLQALNNLHAAAAARARRSLVVRLINILVIIRAPIRWRRWHIEQPAAQRELFGAMTIRQQSVITNPMEAVRQNVQKEAAYEFTRFQRHDILAAAAILAVEADVPPVHSQQAIIGDRDTMRVARKIGQHLLGSGERPFGVDGPVDSAQWREGGGKCGLVV